MRPLFLSLFLFLAPRIAKTEELWHVTPVSSLQKLTASAPGVLEPFGAEPVTLRAARGEWESFQFVVTAGEKPVENLQIASSGLSTIAADFIAAQNLEFFRENFVFIPKPSGNRRLEKLWWPDALIPLQWEPKQRVEAGKSQVFWATVKIPESAAPGDYFGELDITADGLPHRLALALRVEPAVLPAPTGRANVAVYYDALRNWYQKDGKTYSEADWDAQKKRYYDFLLDFRLNAYDLPVSWDAPDAEKYLQDPRVLSVRTPPLDAPDFALALEKFRATNTLKKAYYYRIDEPTPDQFARVRETTQKLRLLGVKHLVTIHPNAALKDAVDIWCPNVGDFFGLGHLDFDALAAERKKGRETWFYTMVEPRFPHPTWLVDDDAASIRSYGAWMREKGFSGFVYSLAHGWGPKPLENIESFAGTNGDGTLLYPGELVGGVGPMPSIRLMLLRDALEDYELKRPFVRPWPVPPGARQAVFVEDSPLLKVAPHIDGSLADWQPASWWPGEPIREGFIFPQRDGFRTLTYLRRTKTHLFLAFRLNQATTGEWVAADFAPRDATYRLRFVVTQKGNLVVEKHTREGHFRPEVPGFRAAIQTFPGFWNAEMQIPLSALPDPKEFRFNLLRRTQIQGTRLTLRAYPDANDPFLMPLVKRK